VTLQRKYTRAPALTFEIVPRLAGGREGTGGGGGVAAGEGLERAEGAEGGERGEGGEGVPAAVLRWDGWLMYTKRGQKATGSRWLRKAAAAPGIGFRF
jgi:hypothetical protein